MTMLEVRDVTVRAGSRTLLEGVGFEAVPGEVVGVIGPNGAGKTTLLEVVVGLRRPDSAAVTYKGSTLQDFRSRARVVDASVPGVPIRRRGRSANRAPRFRLSGRSARASFRWSPAHSKEIRSMKCRPIVLTFSSYLCLYATGCDRPTQPPSSSASAPPPAQSVEPPTRAPSVAAPATSAEPTAAASAARGGPVTIDFDAEPAGAPSTSFEGVVGDWYVGEQAGAHGLVVDGGKWRNGTPSANLADQAKHLYGERYAEFLDGVKAFAFFPFAVYKVDPVPGDLKISVRFFPIAGRVDQA